MFTLRRGVYGAGVSLRRVRQLLLVSTWKCQVGGSRIYRFCYCVFRNILLLLCFALYVNEWCLIIPMSSRGTKKSQFRSYRRRKAKNTANKRLCRSRKKASSRPLRRRKASFTCLRRKKASLRRSRAKNYNDVLREKKNRNILAKIVLILLISRTRNLESIY